MTTTIPSPTRKRASRRAGFSLVELIVGAGLSSFILLGTISSFLFLGRSGANIQSYSDMESQGRKALEIFAEDVRQASAITWVSNVQISLTVNSANIVYAYNSGTAIFARTDASGTRTLISGIRSGSFSFRSFNLAGTEMALTTPAQLAAAGTNTKQLQISLEASRSNQTVVTATNTVLSARFILRNKIVTA
jgi:Tfp pilus assembly protein PilW